MGFTQNNEAVTASQIIYRNFIFLEEEFYFPSAIIESDSAVFIRALNIDYTNEFKGQQITIGYTKGQVFNEVTHTFTCSITRIPYKDVTDYFSLHIYLQSIGKDFNTSIVNEFSEVEAEKIVKKIANALQEHAREIIRGEVWKDNFYPRRD